jgi:cell division protein FtsI (penicillin-binding protein 3)
LQYLAYRELKQALDSNAAVSGSAVVLDVTTGEVLAMVNLPSFNPNVRGNSAYTSERKNQAVTDFMEPGSVAKALSLISVLERGEVGINTEVDTSPGILKVKGGVVRDPRNLGKIDLATILLKSSNIGITKLILKYPASNLWDIYDRLGFGVSTGSGFPGESAGILNVPHKDRPFVLATMSFGYGFAVTPLQLARGYAIVGAHGVKRPTTFARVDEPLPGVQVISPRIAREVVDLLTVVAKGYKSADVPGYNIAGKSGTTRKLGKNGYDKSKHRAVFAGLAPAINPKFSIVVTIDQPSAGKYYASEVVAPAFAKIASGALRFFNVQPDLMHTQGVFIAKGGNNHS